MFQIHNITIIVLVLLAMDFQEKSKYNNYYINKHGRELHMALEMQEEQYLAFYKDSMLGYSKAYQKYVIRQLKQDGRITDEDQCAVTDKPNILVVEKHQDDQSIIEAMAQKTDYAVNFEYLEFVKLYKYSVPFFYSTPAEAANLNENIATACALFDPDAYTPDYYLGRSIGDSTPFFLNKGDEVLIKFVLQKAFLRPEDYQPINYRYPVVIYINPQLSVLEIRFDAVRFDPQFGKESYEKLLNDCLEWIKASLKVELFLYDGAKTIDVVNSKKDKSIKIYKQMMELGSGGSAELTAYGERDLVMPFIGEIRDLIDENEELFSQSTEIKELLLNYLNEKEKTANYPYIYIKRVKPVETDSYIFKITFDYFLGKFTTLQHQTGTCRDLGMERMNNAIKYLSESGSFTKGDPA